MRKLILILLLLSHFAVYSQVDTCTSYSQDDSLTYANYYGTYAFYNIVIPYKHHFNYCHDSVNYLAFDSITHTLQYFIPGIGWTVLGTSSSSYTASGYLGQSGFSFFADTTVHKLATKTNLNSYYLASNPSNFITLGSLSGTAPLNYNNSTGIISMGAASGSANGYLTSSDWGLFNGKQGALNGSGLVRMTGTTVSYDNTAYGTGSVTDITAGTGLSGGIITATGTISMPNTGTPGTYGSTSSFPVITTDAQGRITTITTQTVTTTSGTVTSVSGTANRITSTGGATPTIDISSTFEGLLGKIANPLSQFASTTSSQLAGVISDETGTGSLVFGISPVLTTPNIGTATGNITGNAATVTTNANLTGDVTSVGNTSSYNNKVPLSKGGTNADLSATGGAAQYLKQSSSGAAITVGVIPTADLPTISLTGNVTGAASGGSIATTIGAGVVTNSMLAGSIDLTSKVIGILPVANGGTNSNSVVVTPTATHYAGWDAGKNIAANDYLQGYQTLVTSATTASITATSPFMTVFTGTVTQTVVLPITSTLASIASGLTQQFNIINQTSATITVNSSSGNLVQTITAGNKCTFTCQSNSATDATGWIPTLITLNGGVASVSNSDNSLTLSSTTGAIVASLNVNNSNTWTKAQAVTPYQLTYGSATSVDLSQSNNFYEVLTGNTNLAVPTNLKAGQVGWVDFDQDVTGSRTLNASPAWCYTASGGTQPTLTTTAYARDKLTYVVDYYSTGSVTCTSATPGVVTWTSNALQNGQRFAFTAGTPPTGTSLNTLYFVTVVSAGTTFKLSTSYSNFQAGTFVATSSTGSGLTGTALSITIGTSCLNCQ